MFVLGLRLAYATYKISSFKEYRRFLFDNVLRKWILIILMTLLTYTYVMVLTDEPLRKVWELRNGKDCPSTMWQIWLGFRFTISDCKKCLPWFSVFASELLFTVLAFPFLLIYRSNKKIGYTLFSLLIILSLVSSYAILDSQNIVYEPAKLLNGDIHYALGYQPSTWVRLGAFVLGVAFGFFLTEGLEKSDKTRSSESNIAKIVRRSPLIQIVLQIVGLVTMAITYFIIAKYLDSKANKKAYAYLLFAPLFFLVGLAFFVLPSFLEGEAKVTKIVNGFLGWRKWVHLDRISTTLLMAGPMVLAANVYGMQSTIYFDWNALFFYTLGDIVLAYGICLVVAAAFESQINKLFSFLQFKIFGNESKYSVLVLEE